MKSSTPACAAIAAAVKRVVAGDHHGPQSHLPQPLEPLARSRLEDVFQGHHAGDAVALADQQRRGALAPPRSATVSFAVVRHRPFCRVDVANDRIRRPFADLLAVRQVDAAHPRLGGEGTNAIRRGQGMSSTSRGVPVGALESPSLDNSTMLLPSGVSSAAEAVRPAGRLPRP